MLAIKNRFASAFGIVLMSGALLLIGCTPPGPRALLQGEKLIQEGKWEEAILSLQKATQLLPNNAQAWNHLGIAYHGNHQTELALKCYKSALWLDRNLAAARYNLGCLLLEQNDVAGAIEQLTSFTFLQPASPEGWTKLGTAQMRAKRMDLAEKSFKTALDLRPNDPETFNNLGLIHLQRRRPQEALAYFTSAITQNANYGPALLNLAVLSQQNPNTRSQALQHYKKYLALEPKPADWEKVQAVAAQLDLEVNPPPLQLNPVVHVPAKTNVPGPSSNSLVRVKPSVTNPPPGILVITQIQTVAVTQTVHVVTPPPSQVAAQPSAPLLMTNRAVAVADNSTIKPTPKPPRMEVTRVQEDLVVKSPQEVVLVSPPVLSQPRKAAGDSRPAIVPNEAAASPPSNRDGTKPGFLSRINPFEGKSKPSAENTAIPGPAAATTSPAPAILQESSPVSRYIYISPEKPAAGVRKEAEKFYAEGVKMHKAGALREAVANYQKAIQWDPAYFEACYNLGLAAYERGQLKQSLAAYEYALSLNPDSIDARYNLGLALKQAGYPLDAVEEFQKILQARPNDSRIHYSLGNLYAQNLKQVASAKEHYQKALELNPAHPKASEIRFWLAHNQ